MKQAREGKASRSGDSLLRELDPEPPHEVPPANRKDLKPVPASEVGLFMAQTDLP